MKSENVEVAEEGVDLGVEMTNNAMISSTAHVNSGSDVVLDECSHEGWCCGLVPCTWYEYSITI